MANTARRHPATQQCRLVAVRARPAHLEVIFQFLVATRGGPDRSILGDFFDCDIEVCVSRLSMCDDRNIWEIDCEMCECVRV